MMEISVNTNEGSPPRREPAVRPAYERAPAKQREGGWGKREWLAWQDRMPLPAKVKDREKIVCKIAGIKSAMFYKMNSGTQFPSERVQRRCELAEIALRVAQDTVDDATKEKAEALLADMDAQLMVVAYHVVRNWRTAAIKKEAAEAIMLNEMLAGLPDEDEEPISDEDRDAALKARLFAKKNTKPVWSPDDDDD